MCCCEKPTINGEPGYRWQPNDKPMTRKPDFPDMEAADELLHEEPGRCGGGRERGRGCDCHSHDYRLVKQYGSLYLLVHHGGGVERIRLHHVDTLLDTLAAIDSNQRYWILHTIYYAHSDANREGVKTEAAKWRQAAAEKRIKTRKQRGTGGCVKVWIESPAAEVRNAS